VGVRSTPAKFRPEMVPTFPVLGTTFPFPPAKVSTGESNVRIAAIVPTDAATVA